MKLSSTIVFAALVAALAGQGVAQTTDALNTEAARMDTLATSQGDSKVVGKISGDFSSFLGSDANAKAVVTGLRYGTPIKLTSTTTTSGSTPTTPTSTSTTAGNTTTTGSTPTTPPTTTTTPGTTTPPATTNTTVINPPTGKMGNGNVYISLALAKQQLGQMGITQPTPEQLKAALVGGTITTGTGTGTTSGTGTATTTTTTTKTELPGILTLRSQNMGWGQIAHKLGYKLGPVVSAMKHSNQTMTTASSSSTGSGVVTAGGQSSGSTESGIVSASGKSHGNSGHTPSGKRASGEGIVSGSGKSVGSTGHAYGHNKGGIVTGSGQAAGASSGAGHGNGQGKGHNK